MTKQKNISYQIKGRDGEWQPCDAEQAEHNLRFSFGNKYRKAMAELDKGETVLLPYGSIRKMPAPSCAAVAEKYGLDTVGEGSLKVMSTADYRNLSRLLEDADAVSGGF